MACGLLTTRFELEPDLQPDPRVLKDLLSYFVCNPQAADDLEGIARWRLLDEVVRRKVEETQRALTWLVDRKYLCETVAVGRSPIFSLNSDKVDDARVLLGRENPLKDERRE